MTVLHPSQNIAQVAFMISIFEEKWVEYVGKGMSTAQ